MEDILSGIDTGKRDRIINAAIGEFAAYPYEKASTNNIVKNAGISKGLLFHYFTNKQVLYEKLIGFVIHTLYEAISAKINWDEPDLFERIKQIAIVKMDVSRSYPHMFDFMYKVLAYKKTGNIAEIMTFYKKYGLDFEQMVQDIYTRHVDYTKFRDPATIAETINIVRWSLEKYGEEQLVRLNAEASLDFNQAVTGLEKYMAIMKQSFYRGENL